MFVKKVKTEKSRVYLQIVEGYRNIDGSIKHKVIEKLGYLDDLDKAHDEGGLVWAKKRANELTEKYRNSIHSVTLSNPNRIMGENESSERFIGALALNPVYKKLELPLIMKALHAKKSKFKGDLNEVLLFLIQSRLFAPESKRSAYTKINQFIDNFTFSEDQMYYGLEIIGDSWEQIKDAATNNTDKFYGYNLEIAHYDGSNFYFEIDKEDDFRKKGVSKEGRHDPIVNYGVLSDKNLVPVDIVIYPGNESEKGYFRTVIEEMKRKHSLKNKIIYVADRGLNCGNNLYTAIITGNGYILGQSLNSEKLEKRALLQDSYRVTKDSSGDIVFKVKSFVEKDAEITYTNDDGKKEKLKMPQKQIVFWSKDYADKQKMEREKLIKKAKNFITSPKSYTRGQIGDASAFIKFATFDKNGVYLEGAGSVPQLDLEAIKAKEALDGYFMVVTSELDMPDDLVLQAYSEQKGQERNFRVDKTYLKIRPVNLSRETRIKAHVLVCFLTHLIIKIIETKVLKNQIPQEQIIQDLKDYRGALISSNSYFMFKYTKTAELLAKINGADARREIQSLSMIKNLFDRYWLYNKFS